MLQNPHINNRGLIVGTAVVVVNAADGNLIPTWLKGQAYGPISRDISTAGIVTCLNDNGVAAGVAVPLDSVVVSHGTVTLGTFPTKAAIWRVKM